MIIEYHMPKLAMAMNEGTINEWLVTEGQKVEAGAPIAVIETEKVAYDCESPEAGFFLPLVAEGETVHVEVLIGCFCTEETELAEARRRYVFGANGGESALPQAEATTLASVSEAASALQNASALQDASALQKIGRVRASPAARKLARTEGVEIEAVTGTGPGGRIVKRDVVAHLEAVTERSGSPSPAVSAVLARTPIKGLRRTIANRMSASLAEAAQVSGHFEADVTRLLTIRAQFVERAEQYRTRVSVNAFLIKAIACAVARVPQVNARVEGDEIVVYRNVNMGIATSVPGATEFDSALVVAVLHNVDRMGVVEIDREMKALLNRVRDGEATPEDLSGSTITMSSTAGIGPPGLTSTPVLNRPNVFMVGPSTPSERLQRQGGDYVSATLLPVSYTFDHRAIDGEPTARFLKALHDMLTEPELMLG